MNEKIHFNRDSFQTFQMKKGDKILVNGHCEIQFEDIQVSGSLDYQVKVLSCSPNTTKVVKIVPNHLYVGGISEQKGSHLN